MDKFLVSTKSATAAGDDRRNGNMAAPDPRPRARSASSSSSSSSSSAASAASAEAPASVLGASSKKRQNFFGDGNPLHTPSRGVSLVDLVASHPRTKWNQSEKAFAVRALQAVAVLKISTPQKIEHVMERWAARAVDPNHSDFAINQIPTSTEIVKFAESMGLSAESKNIAALKPAPKKRRKRDPMVFHCNDTRKSSANYLQFPLTIGYVQDTDGDMTKRRVLAFCRALGIKGRSSGLRAKLEAVVDSAGGSMARPDNP